LISRQAIAGFAVVKFLSKTFRENFPVLGGSFGPRENNIVQTAAMASGGLSSVFVSAFPALWKIVSLTVVGGYFGFFFATPSEYIPVASSYNTDTDTEHSA
jgi:uncharacterized oligopeptide transporter (OPT) family protein